MKKLFCLFLCTVFFVCLPVSANETDVPQGLSAKAYALAEIESGKLIAGKNSDSVLPMASTTKIMTALIAVESDKLDLPVYVTESDVKVEGSSLSLRAGDVLTLENLTRGMMTVSGNDAAHTIARFLAGSDEKFAELMNEKAKELKMYSTNFANPHGLPDDNHYTTAEDMVKLTVAALKNPVFLDIVSSYKTEITYIESALGYDTRKLTNTNKLLNLVDGCIGVKTGYTAKSGRCLVSAVKREGTGVICVVLNCPNYWEDSKALLEYGMTKVIYADIITDTAEYSLNVYGGDKAEIRVQNTEYLSGSMLKSDLERLEIRVLLPKFVYAPVKAGDRVGEIEIFFDSELYSTVPIVATETVRRVGTASTDFFGTLTENIEWLFK